MFDRSLVVGLAAQAIAAWNQGKPAYQFRNAEGVLVGAVHGIWQALEQEDNEQEGSTVARYGSQRHVFKTDPDSQVQPVIGWIMVADGKRWRVAEESDREGFFRLWTLVEAR